MMLNSYGILIFLNFYFLFLYTDYHAVTSNKSHERMENERSYHEIVFHPHVCRLVLQLTSVCRNRDGSPVDRNVVENIMFWLVSLARKSSSATNIMHQQVIKLRVQSFSHLYANG